MSINLDSSQRTTQPLVILPTYNEADNIILLLKAIEALPLQISILVVDDSSPDGTAEKVINYPSFGENVFLLKRPRKSGLGSAYREGFQWGSKKGHDICLQMDSDLSHDPSDIPLLLKAIHDGADIAIGSRYVNGISVINWPLKRLLLSTWAGVYTRFITRMPIFDPTSGFEAVHRNVFEKFSTWDMKTDGYGFLIEIKYLAWSKGFTIKEIPIIFTERRIGRSKFSLPIAIESAMLVLRLGLGRIWR
jgi:dolichol-phosphate mannosyltransferase